MLRQTAGWRPWNVAKFIVMMIHPRLLTLRRARAAPKVVLRKLSIITIYLYQLTKVTISFDYLAVQTWTCDLRAQQLAPQWSQRSQLFREPTFALIYEIEWTPAWNLSLNWNVYSFWRCSGLARQRCFGSAYWIFRTLGLMEMYFDSIGIGQGIRLHEGNIRA
jgi:hypothetical protein